MRIFHLYRGSHHKIAISGDFIKGSVRQASPLSVFKKGYKSKALVIRTKSASKRKDGSYLCFNQNSVILLKKRLTPRGKELVGPITYGLKRRKVTASFLGVA